jgi:hypothetical protein
MKYIAVLLLIFVIGLFIPGKAYASLADNSDLRVQKEVETAQLRVKRTETLRRFFKKYNSDLEPYSAKIVAESEEHKIPYTLVPAISGIESTFCKQIPYNSYNCWGWANGDYSFKDYNDAIEIVSKTLGTNYFGKGLDTPEKISPVYAPPSKTWGRNVRHFMDKIEEMESTPSSNLTT